MTLSKEAIEVAREVAREVAKEIEERFIQWAEERITDLDSYPSLSQDSTARRDATRSSLTFAKQNLRRIVREVLEGK